MILTVTLNPSIDIFYSLEELALDTVNRIHQVTKTAGGKGLNVTRVLSECSEQVLATGFLGGELGDFLLRQLPLTISSSFYKIEGNTRNCIAILHGGQQTEILEAGPMISKTEAAGFLNHFKKLLKQVTVVSISGSLALGLPTDYYVQLVRLINKEGKKAVLDCSGKALAAVLKSTEKPYLIKPNNEELSQLLGREIPKEISSLKAALEDSLFDGVEWIIVSLGAEGCFAKHGSTYYKVDIPKISVVNPVGSGDATVAGIVSALYHEKKDEELLKQANVLGMLNAQEKMTGHVNLKHYQTLFDQIKVREV